MKMNLLSAPPNDEFDPFVVNINQILATRLYSVEHKSHSMWKKFTRKVNMWNGICFTLCSVSISFVFKFAIGPTHGLVQVEDSKTELTRSRTQNRS